MLEDNKWLKELMSSYTDMNNPVAEPAKEEVLNEECIECNESADAENSIEEAANENCVDRLMDSQDMSREEAAEECKRRRDHGGLAEETSDEDFMVSLLEDVQNAVGEELSEEEIETILETVSLVVEGMVKKMKAKKPKDELPYADDVHDNYDFELLAALDRKRERAARAARAAEKKKN
jgi:hypothetical protein